MILSRNLFARDLSEASCCRPRPRRVVLHMRFQDRRRCQPPGSGRSLREAAARPQPVASVHSWSAPPADGRPRRPTRSQLSLMISSNWSPRTGAARKPGRLGERDRSA